MKIIKIDDTLYDLTVDSTLISVDSTEYSADATIYLSEYANIKLVPRILPNEGDTLIVKLRNEITNKVVEPENYFNYLDNYFNLFIKLSDLKEGSKFELEIFRDNVEIYKGKALATSKSKLEIQNYSNVKIENNKLKY